MREVTVGTRELKNRLSEYLRRVKAGEMITVTERGKPIGQIVPVWPTLKARLEQLVQVGIVEWSGERLPPYQPKAANRSRKLLSELVAEERR